MRIVLFGTGNLATRLGIALQAKNADIVHLYGRTETNTAILARNLGCKYTTLKEEITSAADIYILAVSDNSIREVSSFLPLMDQLVVHTAGSVPMEILAASSKNYGVFYPLQTLSCSKEVDLSVVPICIEASNAGSLEKLNRLASLLSEHVVNIDSAQRKQLHLAAIFVCNFVNHFYAIGEQLLSEQRLDFELIKPLILETANKALSFSPRTVQTGPAMRKSTTVMNDHLEMLGQHPEWQKLYELISKDIKHFHQ